MAQPASVSEVRAIMDHPRSAETWIVRAVLKDGKPEIERIARLYVQRPADGAGRLRVAVTDWGTPGADREGDPSHYVGLASGFGYDKRTAALAGATVGGFELGDHCDSKGRPTLRALLQREGWEAYGADMDIG